MRLDGYGLFFKEMEEIRQALICGSDMYELKYSVKTRKTFLSVKAAQ